MQVVMPSMTGFPTRPCCEVADIFRQHGEAYRQAHRLPLAHLKAMHAIEVCRTAYLGGHLEQCNRCGFQRPVYNSCRNRNCPKCQALAKARWLEARKSELLPVSYFHNVFTLPHEVNGLALCNQKVVYTLLFQSVAQTLQEFAADPRHGLSGQLGFTAVLHTWDQKLLHHIHLHCVIAGGALSFDGRRWLHGRHNFLFPVKALSRVFRGKFLDLLGKAFTKGQLVFPGMIEPLQTPQGFQELLDRLWQKEWIVYSKKPFAGPEQVLDYLGRYTHRIAISNHRLRQVENGQVTFDYRDRKDGNKVKTTTITATEFIRRFLLHVVPSAFCRIRHFGFLANRVKHQQLQRCRQLLDTTQETVATPVAPRGAREQLLQLTGIDVSKCPQCQAGTMIIQERLPGPPSSRSSSTEAKPRCCDSS